MIEEKVNTVVLKLCATNDKLSSNQMLREDLGFDSLKMVELIVALEEEFEVEIDESDLNPSQLIHVIDIYNLMEKYACRICN